MDWRNIGKRSIKIFALVLEEFTYNGLVIHVTDDPNIVRMHIPDGFVRLYSFKNSKRVSFQMPLSSYQDQSTRYLIAGIIEKQLNKCVKNA